MKSKTIVIVFLITIFATTLLSAPAHAACTSITANAMPYTITAPGNYCVTGFVSKAFSAPAITIAADNVDLDLGGFEIVQNTVETQTGIYSAAQSNVTVRNGTLTNFHVGISLNSNMPTAKQNNVVRNISVNVPSNGMWGINVNGDSSVVRDCIVRGDGTTAPSEGIAMGNGSGGHIMHNDIYGARYEAILMEQSNGIIENNTIGNSSVIESSIGIYTNDLAQNNIISNNRITNMETGIYYTAAASGKFRDNLTMGCTTPWTTPLPAGVIDAGNNN